MKRENLLIACVLLVAVVLAGCKPIAPAGGNAPVTAAASHFAHERPPGTVDPRPWTSL